MGARGDPNGSHIFCYERTVPSGLESTSPFSRVAVVTDRDVSVAPRLPPLSLARTLPIGALEGDGDGSEARDSARARRARGCRGAHAAGGRRLVDGPVGIDARAAREAAARGARRGSAGGRRNM